MTACSPRTARSTGPRWRRIFGDDAARATLEGIVHPLVRARTAELIAAAPEGAVVVNDVPLIVEKRMSRLYETVVVVFASLPTRLDRLVRLRGMTAQEAQARIAAQASDEQRREVADVAIVNDGSPEDLDAAVAAAWPAIAGTA